MKLEKDYKRKLQLKILDIVKDIVMCVKRII